MVKTFVLGIVLSLGVAISLVWASPSEAPEQGATKLPANQITYDQVQGILVVTINEKPSSVIFIAKDGRFAAVDYYTCGKIKYCHDLFNRIVADHRAEELALIDGTQI